MHFFFLSELAIGVFELPNAVERISKAPKQWRIQGDGPGGPDNCLILKSL